MGTLKDSEKTKSKLMEAAGELFSKRGFNGVTVRDIAKAATVPLSAINYHFRTKEILYSEVLMKACEDVSISNSDQQILLNLDPCEALYLFIEESIKFYNSENDSNWQNVLISRECWEPSNVFGDIFQKHLKPQADFISTLVGRVVDKSNEDTQVRFAVVSLIGLLDTFVMYDRYIQGIAPELEKQLSKQDLLAKQLYRLTVEAAGVDISEIVSPNSFNCSEEMP